MLDFGYRFLLKKTIARKFDATASVEVWSTASDVLFREEFELEVFLLEVKSGPKLFKAKKLRISCFELFQILKISKKFQIHFF